MTSSHSTCSVSKLDLENDPKLSNQRLTFNRNVVSVPVCSASLPGCPEGTAGAPMSPLYLVLEGIAWNKQRNAQYFSKEGM